MHVFQCWTNCPPPPARIPALLSLPAHLPAPPSLACAFPMSVLCGWPEPAPSLRTCAYIRCVFVDCRPGPTVYRRAPSCYPARPAHSTSPNTPNGNFPPRQLTPVLPSIPQHFRWVVHSVEKFVAKSRSEFKVPGLYVIDSILHNSRHKVSISSPCPHLFMPSTTQPAVPLPFIFVMTCRCICRAAIL